jgi:hypothetical protein
VGGFDKHSQTAHWAEDPGSLVREFQWCHDFGLPPLEKIPEDGCDIARIAGNEQNELAFASLLPNSKRRASMMGKGRPVLRSRTYGFVLLHTRA